MCQHTKIDNREEAGMMVLEKNKVREHYDGEHWPTAEEISFFSRSKQKNKAFLYVFKSDYCHNKDRSKFYFVYVHL